MNQADNVERGLFVALRKLTPKVTGGLLRMRQEAYRDGAVAAKYNLLTAMAISQDELIEFLEVAMTMQGCPGEEWALKAWSAYQACRAGTPSDPAASCCSH